MLGSGSGTSDTTEHILFQVEKKSPFGFSGWIDLKNISTGAVIVIKQYYKISPTNTYSLYAEDSYEGPLPETLIHFREKMIVSGAKVTVHQSLGVGFIVYWEFYKD